MRQSACVRCNGRDLKVHPPHAAGWSTKDSDLKTILESPSSLWSRTPDPRLSCFLRVYSNTVYPSWPPSGLQCVLYTHDSAP